jgi:hypothetical protein
MIPKLSYKIILNDGTTHLFYIMFYSASRENQTIINGFQMA